jgi:hypothetical protein
MVRARNGSSVLWVRWEHMAQRWVSDIPVKERLMLDCQIQAALARCAGIGSNYERIAIR